MFALRTASLWSAETSDKSFCRFAAWIPDSEICYFTQPFLGHLKLLLCLLVAWNCGLAVHFDGMIWRIWFGESCSLQQAPNMIFRSMCWVNLPIWRRTSCDFPSFSVGIHMPRKSCCEHLIVAGSPDSVQRVWFVEHSTTDRPIAPPQGSPMAWHAMACSSMQLREFRDWRTTQSYVRETNSAALCQPRPWRTARTSVGLEISLTKEKLGGQVAQGAGCSFRLHPWACNFLVKRYSSTGPELAHRFSDLGPCNLF